MVYIAVLHTFCGVTMLVYFQLSTVWRRFKLRPNKYVGRKEASFKSQSLKYAARGMYPFKVCTLRRTICNGKRDATVSLVKRECLLVSTCLIYYNNTTRVPLKLCVLCLCVRVINDSYTISLGVWSPIIM